MQISDIFLKLEALLDNSGLDEGWSDWLRDCAEKSAHVTGQHERRQLFSSIEHNVCDGTFHALIRFLPDSSTAQTSRAGILCTCCPCSISICKKNWMENETSSTGER